MSKRRNRNKRRQRNRPLSRMPRSRSSIRGRVPLQFHPSLLTKGIAVALLLAVYLVTLARGIGTLHDWQEAHWLLSYDLGFIKRALIGTGFAALQHALPLYSTESLLHASAWVFLLAFYTLYFCIVFMLVKRAGFSLLAVAIGMLFVSSPYIVMAGDLIGYFDNIIAMLAVLACFLVHKGRIRMVGVTLAAGVLVHENMLLVGLPSVLVFAFAHKIAGSGAGGGTALLGYARHYWPLAALPLLSALALYVNQEFLLDAAAARDMITARVGQYSFVQGHGRFFAPNALAISFGAHLSNESPCFAMRLTDGFFVSRIIPVQLAILAFYWCSTAAAKWKRTQFVMALSSALLPLAMHIIAFDVERIWTYPVFTMLLACLAFSRAMAIRSKPPWQLPLGLILVCGVIVQCLTVYPLFDGDVDRLAQWLPSGLELPFLPSSPAITIGECRLKLGIL